jgi:hypothetical protein
MVGELLPQVADIFLLITTEAMDPGVRRNDGGVCVDVLRKFLDSNFKQPSALVLAPPRELGF